MGETTSITDTAGKLHAVATLLERYPDLPAPMVTVYASGRIDVDWLINHDEHQLEAMRQIRRTIGGTWDKDPVAGYFLLRREVDGIPLTITADREQVCERVVVGTETVTFPAVEAQPERVEEREVVEWRCEPIGDEAVR